MTNPEALLRSARNTLDIEIAALQRFRERFGDEFARAVELLYHCRGKVVITGMGKSGLIAQKIAATMCSLGTLAVFLHPAEGMHGDLGMVSPQDVVIALSKSGVSDEIVGMYPVLKRIGTPIIAIVGDSRSYMARHSEVVIDAAVEREACHINLAPTASTTLALVIGDMLAVALSEAKGYTPADFALVHPAGRLGKRLLLKVSDVMHGGAELPSCQVSSPMRELLVEMTSKGLGCVVLTDAEGRLVGFMTDGDLRRGLQRHPDLLAMEPSALMTRAPKTVPADSLAYDALVLMEQGERQISQLPVVDSEGRPLGVVRVHDLVRAGL